MRINEKQPVIEFKKYSSSEGKQFTWQYYTNVSNMQGGNLHMVIGDG